MKKKVKKDPLIYYFFLMENLQEYTCIILLVSFQQTENTSN